MGIFFSRRNREPDTDWDYCSGYPPNLTMRRRVQGKWEYRPASGDECAKFLRAEAEFDARSVKA